PLDTIGGGEVLDPSPMKRRKKDGISDLEVFEKGSLEDKLAYKVKNAGLHGISAESLEGWIKAEVPEIRKALNKQRGKQVVLRFGDILFHRDAFELFRRRLVEMLKEFHKQNPLKSGMPKEEVRVKMKSEPRSFSDLVEKVDEVIVKKDLLVLEGFSTDVSSEDRLRILNALEVKGYHPPTVVELAKELGLTEKKLGDILRIMHKEEEVVRISDAFYLSPVTHEQMVAALKAHYDKNDDMTVAEFRDILGTSRKYALPLLEYLDSSKVTMRVGDVRKFIGK
ncbi:SelB C-terminal domain-containing protein, partial [Nitrospirota bacterium]